jgi:hypothetical protein
MNTTVTESLRVWRRRALAAGGALMLAGTVVALTAAAASAEMRCHFPPGSNTCLTIEPYVYHWLVRVGIDIFNIYNIAGQSAFDLINAANAVGMSPFVARIRGDDGSGFDPILFTVPLTATASWGGILSGEGYVVVPSSALNEDTNGSDELYAEVILQDCSDFHRIGCYHFRWFYSGFIVDNW